MKDLNKVQVKDLLELVYLGNWMINAVRTEEIEKYEQMTQYIYRLALQHGLDDLIEYDLKFNQFFPTRLLEEGDLDEYREFYHDDVIWGDLADRLADRDMENLCSEKELEQMPEDEMIRRRLELIGKYEDEFEKHGLARLKISEDNDS